MPDLLVYLLVIAVVSCVWAAWSVRKDVRKASQQQSKHTQQKRGSIVFFGKGPKHYRS